MNSAEVQKLKQQIIFSQMPISEKDFWLLIIKHLKDQDLPVIQKVLDIYKQKGLNKTKLVDLKNKKNLQVSSYNDSVIAKIQEKLDNMISEELDSQDLAELQKIRSYFNGLNNGN